MDTYSCSHLDAHYLLEPDHGPNLNEQTKKCKSRKLKRVNRKASLKWAKFRHTLCPFPRPFLWTLCLLQHWGQKVALCTAIPAGASTKKLSGRETKSSTFSMLLFHFSKNASTSLRCPVVLLLEDPSRWTSLLAQVCTRHLLWSISCPVTNTSPARATVWLVRFSVSEMKMSNVFQCSNRMISNLPTHVIHMHIMYIYACICIYHIYICIYHVYIYTYIYIRIYRCLCFFV